MRIWSTKSTAHYNALTQHRGWKGEGPIAQEVKSERRVDAQLKRIIAATALTPNYFIITTSTSFSKYLSRLS